jgi:hypothetical protein
MKEFFHKHLEFYSAMIERSHDENPQRRKTDIDPMVAARIAQIVMIGAGIFESVDQTNIDQFNLTRYVLSLIKG